MTTLKAHFDGQVLVPEEAIELPMNCILEVTVQPVGARQPAQQATLDLMRQWEREDENLTVEQRAQDDLVYAEIERDGIERARL